MKIFKGLTKTCFLVLIWSEYVCYLCVYFRIIIFSFLLVFFSFSPAEILYISTRVLLYVFGFNFSFCVNNGLEEKIFKKCQWRFYAKFVQCRPGYHMLSIKKLRPYSHFAYRCRSKTAFVADRLRVHTVLMLPII